MKTVVVTRHSGLVDHLKNIGLIDDVAAATVIADAKPADIAGKHVIGVLPIHLAALADRITIIPLDTPKNLRGVDLDADDVARFAGDPATFVIRRVD